MTFILEGAARRTSGVAHVSSTWAQLGAVGVGGVAAVIVLGSNPVGWLTLLAAGGAALTYGGAASAIGSVLDDLEGASITERIATGAPDVFIDEPKLEAAYAAPDCVTDVHGDPVETGSDSVFIHGYPASRVTDAVECGGIIKEGSAHVFYGGETGNATDTPSKNQPLWLQVFDFTSSVVGLRGPAKALVTRPESLAGWAKSGWELLGGASTLTGLAQQAGLVDLPPVVADAKTALDVVGSGSTLVTGAGKIVEGITP
jgi:uncharacterized Zn-binding protein involved in type VI secretion